MQEAIRQSKERMEEGKGGPFGAVVVKDGKIVATGYNQVTSLNDPTAHAEVMAIREACKKLGSFQLEGCELPVVNPVPCAWVLSIGPGPTKYIMQVPRKMLLKQALMTSLYMMK